jgi:hypothetical protein
VANGQSDLATDHDRNRTAMIENGAISPTATKIVWTSDDLPNDAIAVRAGFDPATAERKTVVVLYDLDEEIASVFKAFADEFDKAALASSIWNIDSAGRTLDWKRNAGAGRLISRKPARFGYGLPSIVRRRASPAADKTFISCLT